MVDEMQDVPSGGSVAISSTYIAPVQVGFAAPEQH